MNLFYVKPDSIAGNHLVLSGQEAHHAAGVMRYREGEQIQVVDGLGHWFRGTVRTISAGEVEVAVEEKKPVPKAKPELILAMGLIKKRQRLEFAVEKSVELGVSEIIFFESAHTERSRVRLDRLEGKAISAMKQSLRAWLPEIRLCHSFEEVLERYKDCPKLMAHMEAETPLSVSATTKEDKLMLLVGPEGGFTEYETGQALQKKATLISLSRYRLRTETAAICLMSKFTG